MKKLYRFDLDAAFDLGEKRQPSLLIHELFSRVTDWSPMMMGACVWFRGETDKPLPPYIVEREETPETLKWAGITPLYLVVLCGIYHKAPSGVFDSFGAAKRYARQLASNQPDDHHSAIVYRMSLNEGLQLEDPKPSYDGWLTERPEYLARYRLGADGSVEETGPEPEARAEEKRADEKARGLVICRECEGKLVTTTLGRVRRCQRCLGLGTVLDGE